MIKRASISALTLSFLLFLARPFSANAEQIHWDRQTFSIGGKDVVLIGGSFHYFRVPEAEWPATFERMKEDGFNVVDVYIPWFVHEPEENKFDFGNLQRFLTMAHAYGLYVVARPGPYINSESDQGAFPRWLSGKGVGYRRNSEADRKWSKHWYDAIMPVLARNQITRGGPVIMVQIENEYGHPKYIPDDEKKEFVRFLYNITAGYGFDVPLMGNDMQFVQQGPSDPVLSKIYVTVDAYFGSYKGLESMLEDQRKLTTNGPLGCAEYGLDAPEATVRTMLGLGVDYMDQYLFRGGSQFAYAAKGYETAGYSVYPLIDEGGFILSKYGAMKATALFLRQFDDIVTRAEPAADPATIDDPEVWLKQRNRGGQGFLFVRSDLSGVSERTLALNSASEQHITYHDPQSGKTRVIPQYTTMLLRREQTRLMVLDLPLSGGTNLVYSTADLLGRFDYSDRSWLVLYGTPGDESEAVFSFPSKPADLNTAAIWNQDTQEAAVRLQFGDRDQIIPLTGNISLLVLSRERAYRAKELSVDGKPALIVSNADDAIMETANNQATLHLELRQPTDRFTVISAQKLTSARGAAKPVSVTDVSGSQQFTPNIAVPTLAVPALKVAALPMTAGFAPSITKSMTQLVSLPEAGIWKKGITRYSASFPTRPGSLRLRFFTDDYRSVYLGGKFVPEAANRSREMILRRDYCSEKTCELQIYYVDTGRPKEDLGLWRLDEKKGLQSADWIDGVTATSLDTEWNVEFAALDDLSHVPADKTGLTVLQYSFSRPASGDLEAVWRAFMPPVPGLVYLNGKYMEHHQPGAEPILGRPGIYLPPSMMKQSNQLLFVTLEPPPANLPLPVIRVDDDSVRQKATVVLQFAGPTSIP